MRRALAAALMTAACATQAAPALPAGQWTLLSLGGALIEGPQPPTLSFSDGRAAGFAGCNQFFATVTREDDATKLTAIGSTRMYCAGAPMETEARYLAMLGAMNSFRLEGDTLVLLDSAGQEIARYGRG